MRIAQISPLYESVPPAVYGGTERVVHYLTEELVRMGHEVTLFGAGDSCSSAKLVAACPQALRFDQTCRDPLAWHMVLLDLVAREQRRYDVLHFHIDYLHFLLSRYLSLPQLTTLHGRLDLPELQGVYDRFGDMPVVSISRAQRFPLPQANWAGTVHHGRPEELYSGIVKPERVAPLTRTLLSKELFSGWGIRTLASDEQRFNPMSYHCGSIWPHDTAIVAAGLARYGAKAEAARLLGGLFDAALWMDLRRMPELFCGFARRPGEAPTQYPVACSPQAWAAGSVFLLLGSVLGLEVFADDGRVVLRHTHLPPFLQEVRIRRLRVGRAMVDLTLRRHARDVGMTVDEKQGDIEVVAVR